MKPIYALPVRVLALALAFNSCGQDPSFVDSSLTQASRASEAASQDAIAAESDVDVDDVSTPVEDNSAVVSFVPETPNNSGATTGQQVATVPSLPIVPSTQAATAPVVRVEPKPSVTPVVTPTFPTQPAPITTPTPAPVPVQPAFPSQPSNPSSPVFTIPGLTPSEQVQVAQCITKWGKVPFTGTFTNVRRIKAAVSVYGIGNVINDVNQTTQPMLVLIDAGVNVMGNPVYNLLNNNGYYCMKVNVNVKTDLDINLACNAKLADNSVQINVASEVDSETSVIGVNVGSNVQVTRMTPNRGECAY
jgi:hypothetical protein